MELKKLQVEHKVLIQFLQVNLPVELVITQADD